MAIEVGRDGDLLLMVRKIIVNVMVMFKNVE